MSIAVEQKKTEHSPRLNTILMVEDTLKESENSMITVAELKRNLPKQINHTVLKTILSYLEESNKLAVSIHGLTWIHNDSKKLKEEIRKGFKYNE